MKRNKAVCGVITALQIIAVIVILVAAMSLGNLVSNIFSVNAYVDDVTFTVVYIFVTLSAGLLYAKYVLHLSSKDIGVCFKPPQIKWIVTGLCLPTAVTVFYLLFTDGQIVKSEYGGFWTEAILTTGIAAGICEEFVFRGVILRLIERRWNKAAAVLISSALFVLLHIFNLHWRTIDMLLLAAAGMAVGIMFSLIALQSKTIWSGAVVHALWNIIILGGFFIIESPDSGLKVNFFYRYELSETNVLLTGGSFGIESAIPAIIGYLIVSVIAFALIKNHLKKCEGNLSCGVECLKMRVNYAKMRQNRNNRNGCSCHVPVFLSKDKSVCRGYSRHDDAVSY